MADIFHLATHFRKNSGNTTLFTSVKFWKKVIENVHHIFPSKDCDKIKNKNLYVLTFKEADTMESKHKRMFPVPGNPTQS